MNLLTSNNSRGGKLFKLTVDPTPATTHLSWSSPETYDPSATTYSLLVSLDRLLNEMTYIKAKGGRIIEVVPADEASVSEQNRLDLTAVGAEPRAVELWSSDSVTDLQTIIAATYKQIFGNTYVLESERLTQAESLLTNRSISVREFVRLLAKSDLYKQRFFYCTSNDRFIELNFKHLLGRPPYNQAEIAEHLDRYQTSGYDADIDSYIDSDEYSQAFGETIVPYWRTFNYQVGQSGGAFGRTLRLYRGEAGSDTNLNRTGQLRKIEPRELLVSGRNLIS
ncbi:phycobilisome rod-core linker polypeptide [Gloeobacter kilaueensis]|uniref:Phycobilisome linker polypeptide n=1 Tax=Gloeobacter kilaueensis (strain ATCC BAA-2537 / CCAP 1431/1 / ULC 316 / JS1) TaxID=1183438 RepID=U5QI34_GLOK1|nr:phycobilisome rod-core linker polypeptide [Gloeobacter kilaueensis]AGY58591.1 phycobilisome linker polypeptide [Gloeobacter kilaueensis JS1]